MIWDGLPSPAVQADSGQAHGRLSSWPKSQKVKNPAVGGFYFLAPRDGLEPPTKWLTATRSTS